VASRSCGRLCALERQRAGAVQDTNMPSGGPGKHAASCAASQATRSAFPEQVMAPARRHFDTAAIAQCNLRNGFRPGVPPVSLRGFKVVSRSFQDRFKVVSRCLLCLTVSVSPALRAGPPLPCPSYRTPQRAKTLQPFDPVRAGNIQTGLGRCSRRGCGGIATRQQQNGGKGLAPEASLRKLTAVVSRCARACRDDRFWLDESLPRRNLRVIS